MLKLTSCMLLEWSARTWLPFIVEQELGENSVAVRLLGLSLSVSISKKRGQGTALPSRNLAEVRKCNSHDIHTQQQCFAFAY